MATTTYAGTATYDTSIEVPDDAEKGVSAISAALESLRDAIVWLKGKAPFWKQVNGSSGTSALISTTDSTYTGTSDYDLFSGVYEVTSGQTILVRAVIQGYLAGGPNACEYRLVYKIGAGSKTALTGAVAPFASMDANAKPVPLEGSITAGSSGTLAIYLQAKTAGVGTVNAYQPFHATLEVRTIDT